jgi:Sulfotransferase family
VTTLLHSPLALVCGHRKSGTTLFANLLDGHPQLAVYPFDLTLLYAYFPDYLRAHTAPAERRARLQRILFTELAQRVPAQAVDVPAMAERFFGGLLDDALGDPGALMARLMAVFQSTTGRAQAQWGVFKETSIEIYAAEILDWFPDARFIQVLRDPRDNFAALAAGVDKHYSRLGEDHKRTLASLLNRVRIGFQMARQNSARYGEGRYRLVRFEDLTGAPEPTMRGIADFLGIDFDPCLLKPTVLGIPAGGNAFDGVATFDVSARHVDRWRERISAEDAQVIEFHLADEMAAFGYAPAFERTAQARAAAEFYKWQNYAYFYGDRFAQPAEQ